MTTLEVELWTATMHKLWQEAFSMDKFTHNRHMTHVRKVIAQLKTMPPPATVTTLEVSHDDDCAIWRGNGCNCEPVVKLGQTEKSSA